MRKFYFGVQIMHRAIYSNENIDWDSWFEIFDDILDAKKRFEQIDLELHKPDKRNDFGKTKVEMFILETKIK